MLLRHAGDVLVELWVEIGEGGAELIELGFWAVDLDAVELGDGEGFLDAGADVFEMAEDAGGTDVGLAAEDLVAANGEVVVEAGVLGAGAGYEFLHGFFEGVELTGLDFEVWVDADGLGKVAHGRIVNVEGGRSKVEFSDAWLVREITTERAEESRILVGG